AQEREGCRELATGDPALDAVLRSLVFQLGDDRKPLASVRVVGLSTIKEGALWEALGGQPAHWDAAQAALLLRRLAGLGLFSRVDPTVEVNASAGPTLVVQVAEHPTVRRVVLEGGSELEPQDMLEELLEAPSREEVESRRVRSHTGTAAATEAARAADEKSEREAEVRPEHEAEEKFEREMKQEVENDRSGVGAPGR